MYEINGDFGKVRLCRTFVPRKNIQMPFLFLDGGWHRCSELYDIYRENGCEGYLLFFSVTDGGRLKIQDKFYEIPASSVSILPPNISHEYYAAEGQWWEFYWLHIGENHTKLFEQLIETQGHVFVSPQADKMGKLIEELFPERFVPDEMAYEIKSSQVISKILHMMLEDVCNKRCEKQKSGDIVQKIIDEIEKNYDRDMNMSATASRNYISVQHMIRLFKANTGYTPYEYLKKYRLQKAGELLMYSEDTVEEIALKTGFSSANNFIFQFKNEHGMTPGNYRALFSK